MTENLSEKFNFGLQQALKEKNQIRISVLRMLLAALHNREIEKKTKKQNPILTEEDILNVLLSEAKKRKEAIEIYEKAKRDDLAEKEKSELKVIQEYLPAQLDEEEVRKIVKEIIKRFPDEKNFGRLMGEAMKELKGRAEAKLVSEIIKSELQ